MASPKHPSLLVYGDTEKLSFPLMLILGREFNGVGDVVRRVGQYNWSESPRSLFWNTTYRLIAQVAGFSEGMALKDFCSTRRSSPIALSNALPAAIPDGATASQKSRLRKAIPESLIHEHASFVLAGALGTRVKLVLLSGADGPDFGAASAVFEEECTRRGLPLATIPYLASRQPFATYRGALGESDAILVRDIVRAFRDST
ncbi:MAG: hypothetical protein AB7T37_06895 [Dehalococcoidia bacterium]